MNKRKEKRKKMRKKEGMKIELMKRDEIKIN